MNILIKSHFLLIKWIFLLDILDRLLAWRSKFEKRKALEKKDKQKINACSVAS